MDTYTAVLNKLVAFSGDESAMCVEVASELESIASDIGSSPLQLNEECVGLCAELLESLHPTSRAMRSVLMFVANCCLSDENCTQVIQFGIPGTCVVALQSHSELPTETLYYAYDLISTLASSRGVARQMLRPAIPYILASMEEHPGSLDVLLGGVFALHSLAMLEAANTELIAERNGIKVLVHTHRNTLRFKSELQGKLRGRASSAMSSMSATVSRQGNQDRIHVCEEIVRWSRTVLLQVCRSSTEIVGTRLREAEFGPFGENISMDELKLTLLFEHKKSVREKAVPACSLGTSANVE